MSLSQGEYQGDPGNNFSPQQDPTSSLSQTNAVVGAFDEARWRRVGADDEDIAVLAEIHDNRSEEEKVAEGQRLSSQPDTVLFAELEDLEIPEYAGEDGETVDYSGTVAEVLDRVGNNPQRAKDALAYEEANKNRVRLVAALESIIDPEE